jgi:hypothetical protein
MSSVTAENIMRLGTAFFASKTLLSAVELGLFTELAQGPAGLSALESKLGLSPRASRDFLDALTALKMLDRRDGLYFNSAEADMFLDRAKPSYMGGLLEMFSVRLFGFWGSLTEALKTGENQNEGKMGGDVFAQVYSNPQRLRGFLAAMTAVSAPVASAMATKFDWSRHKTFVDVGTAQGVVPVTLCRSHIHLEGIGFDLPVVGPTFEDFVAANRLSQRIRFTGGSFFENPIPNADVVIMGHILHDWDLSQKKMLLRKAYEALPAGGAIIVYDTIIDDDRCENVFGLLMSLNMLIETPGGFDYSGADCIGWMEEAGFSNVRVEHLHGPNSMVTGHK